LRRQEQFTKYLSRAKNIFAALGDTVNIGQIMNLWGDLSYQQQDLEGAIKNWQLALDSMLNSGEWMAATHMRWQISGVYMQIGDFEKAFDGFHAVADVFREHGLRLEEVSTLSKESFEKVRYGDIEEALQIRRTCLEMILEIGLSYQIAWNYWEMGEVLRVKGDVTAAAQWYERAYQIFDREQDNNGRAYYFRGLGDIALGEQNYEAARSHFSTSADLAKSTNHTWLIAYSLSKLARAQLELEDSKSAKKNLRAAFQYGLKTLDKGIVLVILVEYAELCSRMGKDSTAVELCSLVKEHFASWHETRKHAATFLDALRNQMPARKYAQSMKKGRALDLWACVKSLINELGTITLTRVPSKKESKKTTIRNLARIK
jgi:tetratricopeptide (TPR) repeat protein